MQIRRLIFFCALVSACGHLPMHEITGSVPSQVGMLAACNYFGGPCVDMHVWQYEDVQAACHNPNAAACLVADVAKVGYTTDEYICQAVMHEAGHAYLMKRDKDYDYAHQDAFYTSGIISTTCAFLHEVEP